MSWLCTSSSASFFHYGKVPELFRNTSGTKTEKLKNCFFQRYPGRDSPYGFSFSVFQFGSGTIWKTETLDAYKQIVVLASMSWLCTSSSASFFHYGKVPELFRNTSGTKTEKLKNCFSREIQEEILHMDSVFQFPELFRNISGETEKLNFPGTCRQRFSIWIQFFSFSVFQFPELFRNISGETEKLKNWIHMENLCLNVPGKFSFSVSPEIFRNSSGNWKTEKLKNWKTVCSREIQEEILHMDSVFQFFSFRNYFGIFPEKLKNWIFQGHAGRGSPYGFSFSVFSFRQRFSIWIQFFSFSVFCRIGQEQVENCFLRVSSLHVMYFVYIIHMVPPKKAPKI